MEEYTHYTLCKCIELLKNKRYKFEWRERERSPATDRAIWILTSGTYFLNHNKRESRVPKTSQPESGFRIHHEPIA